jgi:hypothetical protein
MLETMTSNRGTTVFSLGVVAERIGFEPPSSLLGSVDIDSLSCFASDALCMLQSSYGGGESTQSLTDGEGKSSFDPRAEYLGLPNLGSAILIGSREDFISVVADRISFDVACKTTSE